MSARYTQQPPTQLLDAGADMSFRIGQHVRHRDYKGERVTGVVRSLELDSERGLMVCIALDAPIVIPAGEGYSETRIWNQHAPAHEFRPFDERDELIAELVSALRTALSALSDVEILVGEHHQIPAALLNAKAEGIAAIAKATGSSL
jgi:hypothetical protein